MKIGFFTDSYLPRLDGIAVSVDIFRRGLEQLGHEVYVICPDRPGAKKHDDHVIYIPSLPSIFYEGYRDSFVLNPIIFKQLLELNLDIVHIHTPTQIGLLGAYVARKASLPTVSTCHSDERLLDHYGWLKHLMTGLSLAMRKALGKKKPLGTTMTSQFYNLFDAVIAPSKKVDSYLRAGGVQKSHIIPTGVEKEFFVDKIPSKNNKVRFVSTSRLVIEKRVEATLSAFLELEDDVAELTIVADGPEIEKLKSMAQKSNKSITFTGKVSHERMRHILQNSDVLVSACQAETQGLVFNEAAAVGLAAIYSDEDINPVLSDGKSAILTDGSSEEIYKAMCKNLNNPELITQYGVKARQLAQAMTSEIQANKLVAVYNQLIS